MKKFSILALLFPLIAFSETTKTSKLPDRILWDAWYTITISKSVKYSYFNEKFELKDGKLFYQSKSWKQEEDYLNEEQLGALAEYKTELTPLFFNFHSSYRNLETMIDGNIKDGKFLTVKAKKGSTELPVIKRSLPSKLILSVFFPIWVGHRLSSMKLNEQQTFSTILEDNLDTNFETIIGQTKMETNDEFATKTKTTKLTVTYKNMKSVWYVEKNGMPIRIENPAQRAVIEKVTKEKATAFLED